MAFRLGAGTIDLTLNHAGLTRAASVVKEKLSGLQQTTLLAAGAFTGLAYAGMGMFRKFVGVLSDTEETMGKFQAVFKEEHPQAMQWMEKYGAEVGRSKQELADFMATLQNIFVPLGFSRKQARELTQQVVELGVDLASFNNTADSDAIESLTSALIGNHESVRKFGVVINQATLEQEILNSGMASSVDEATNQQKALARLNIILRSTADAQGDARRTADSFSNQMKALRAQIQNATMVLKDRFYPALTKVVSVLRSMVGPITKFVADWGGVIFALTAVTAAVWGLNIVLPQLWGTLATIGKILLGLVGVIGWIPSLILGIASAVIYTKAEGESFGEKMKSIWESMQPLVQWVVGVFWWFVDMVSSAFNAVIGYVAPYWTKFCDLMVVGFSIVKAAVVNWRLTLETAMMAVALAVMTIFDTVYHIFIIAIPNYLEWFAKNWKSIFLDVVNWTSYVFENLGKNIWNFCKSVWKWFSGEGWSFNWTPLTEGFQRVTEKAPDFWKDFTESDATKAARQRLKETTSELGAAMANEINKATSPTMKKMERLVKSADQNGPEPPKSPDVSSAQQTRGEKVQFVALADLAKRLSIAAMSNKGTPEQQRMEMQKRQLEQQQRATMLQQEQLNQTMRVANATEKIAKSKEQPGLVGK